MKLANLKEYIKGKNKLSLESLESYINLELMESLREIRDALIKLRFQDNFQCFQVTITIPATTELAIPNQLRGTIPTTYTILNRNQYGAYVCDGDTEWTLNNLYLKNPAASSATLTVVFFK